MSTFSTFAHKISQVSATSITGQVKGIIGLTLTVSGLERAAGIGQRCRVKGKGQVIESEVVGMGPDGLRLLPFGKWQGIAIGDPVELVLNDTGIHPDDSWIGTVVDALGHPLSRAPRFSRKRRQQVAAKPPPVMERKLVGEKLETQIKCIDVFTPICRGQRMGIFAGSGVGKSTLMAMLARNTNADVIVMGLIGERGREVREFIEEDLGEEGLARSVIVVSTGDEAPLLRRQAAWTAMSVAEHFRATGRQVLLLLDSVTRFAMAQREIGLAVGEPPTTRGYPPTVFSELPQLLERAGPGRDGEGDITGVFTVLVDGDDLNEPVADAVRGIVDGHLVLDRNVAERNRYPAIDVQRSISRMLPGCHDADQQVVLREARKAMARYSDMEELIRIGAYKPGSDPETDKAIKFFEQADPYLSQVRGEKIKPEQAFVEIFRMLLEAGIDVDLPSLQRTEETREPATPELAE